MSERTRQRPAPQRALRIPPKVKLGAGVAVASAIVAGIAGGSQLPAIVGGDAGSPFGARSAAAGADGRLGAGTAAAVTAGPYHPVDGEFDYGEADAHFGAWRGGRRHEGEDVFAKVGTPLVAVRAGIVVDEAREDSAYSGGRGNFIAIYSEVDDRTHVYFHMRRRSPLREGDPVGAGDPVGEVGCSGSCWGDHLHFEIRLGRGAEGKPIDPMPPLRDWPRR